MKIEKWKLSDIKPYQRGGLKKLDHDFRSRSW